MTFERQLSGTPIIHQPRAKQLYYLYCKYHDLAFKKHSNGGNWDKLWPERRLSILAYNTLVHKEEELKIRLKNGVISNVYRNARRYSNN